MIDDKAHDRIVESVQQLCDQKQRTNCRGLHAAYVRVEDQQKTVDQQHDRNITDVA
ncbi:hypothetical protein SDC9_146779 [bioreactor metagenome]|uniref:Uncharacterized protein n=1 Tax=bioreactor metagenome TaxID=1076179 RepID=A0A645EC82_9ZZZZ